jgi:histidine ammonia-lyase
MTVTLHTRADITLDVYGRVAWQGEDVHFDPAALVRIGDCRAAFLRLIEDPAVVVYGVTSGYGQMAHLRFTPEERRQHAAKPAHAAMASFGEPLPERVTRGMVLARLANFVDGHAAVSPALAEAVAGLLSGAPLPLVPALGNGCPGEILALSHLLTPLAETFDLGEKETLSLVNGSPCAAALIADAVLAGRNRLALAAQVFALSIEAMKAPLGAYDEALDDLWGDPHEAAALRSLRSWLDGVHADDDGRRPYQAPVSWRIVPRVLGQAWRSLAAAEEVAATSLRSVSDNPVFLPPDAAHPNGRVFSTGGYHNAAAYPALDNLAACWADLALLCDRQVTKLMDGKVSLLPHLLMREDGYLGCLGFSAAGYAEQARQAAQRSFLPGSEGGGFAQNDVAVPTFLSWRKEAEAGQCLEAALAILAAIASQALYITERSAPPRLRPFVEVIHQSFPPVSRRRPLGRDAQALHGALRARVYSGDVAENNRVLSMTSH